MSPDTKDLKELAEAYDTHQGRNTWLRSDEADSLSREADKAFVQAGLRLHLYPPIRNASFCSDEEKAGKDLSSRWSQRIEALGGIVAPAIVPAW